MNIRHRADDLKTGKSAALLHRHQQLGTFTVGMGPFGMAFDGANIWVSNEFDNSVTKLRANDGTVLGTFAVGVDPRCVAFDGANVWVTNNVDNTVSKL